MLLKIPTVNNLLITLMFECDGNLKALTIEIENSAWDSWWVDRVAHELFLPVPSSGK